jgi:hypothetical protein
MIQNLEEPYPSCKPSIVCMLCFIQCMLRAQVEETYCQILMSSTYSQSFGVPPCCDDLAVRLHDNSRTNISDNFSQISKHIYLTVSNLNFVIACSWLISRGEGPHDSWLLEISLHHERINATKWHWALSFSHFSIPFKYGHSTTGIEISGA